ncbi:MAG: hypothetical protein ACKVZH_05150 [Blastocatellia bacterium]
MATPNRISSRELSQLTVAMLVDNEVLAPGTSRFLKGQGDPKIANALRRLVSKVAIRTYSGVANMAAWLEKLKPDVVFNLTEHVNADRKKDSHICALLELLELPYTGTGLKGLMLCRDKAISKIIVEREGFKVPKFFVAGASLPSEVTFPIVVKPRCDDASIGISQASLVNTIQALKQRIAVLERAGIREIICEEFIAGREMLVGFVGNQVMPVREILVGRDSEMPPPIISYRMKHDKPYQRRWAMRTRFAQLTPGQESSLMERVLRTCEALELRDYGRLDLKLTPAGEWVFLEANPNPLLYPFKGSRYGIWSAIEFDKLIEQVLFLALQRKQ